MIDPEKTRELILAHLDGTAHEQETSELDRLLATDAELANQFAAQSLFEQVVTGYFTDQTDAKELERLIAAAGEISQPASQRAVAPPKTPVQSTTNAPTPTWIGKGLDVLGRQSVFSMIFALAFMFAGLTILAMMRTDGRPQASEDVPALEPPCVVAQITGTRDALWDESDSTPVTLGSRLVAGHRARLLAGFVEITWRRGTRVILEGPTDLVVVSENSIHLNKQPAKLTVCDGVRGFTVGTEALQVVDLGTEFAIEQRENHFAVHVFDGLVQVTPVKSASASSQLEAGESANFDTKSGRRLSTDLAQIDRFVRSIRPNTLPTKNRLKQLVSTFDRDADGWTVSFDSEALLYVTDGGNPGGCVRGTDQGKAAYFDFLAPARFLGDRTDLLGDTLRYDLLIRLVNGQTGRLDQKVDVVLVGGGRQLGLMLPDAPAAGEWTTCRARLSADAGWFMLDDPAIMATEDDLLAALADLRELRIRGEFFAGWDAADLDNVIFGEATASSALQSDKP